MMIPTLGASTAAGRGDASAISDSVTIVRVENKKIGVAATAPLRSTGSGPATGFRPLRAPLPFSMNPLFNVAMKSPAVMIAARRHFLPFGFSWSIHAVLAIIAGVLILIRPKLLNFIIALYLILIGLNELFRFPR